MRLFLFQRNLRMIHNLHNPNRFETLTTAILRERCAESSQNSSDSSDSLAHFCVGNVVIIVTVVSDGHRLRLKVKGRKCMIGGGGDEKMAAAMAALRNVQNVANVVIVARQAVTSRFL